MKATARLEGIISRWHEWADEQPVVLEQMSGGLTNENYLVAADDKKYVLRVNSEFDGDYNINRDIERQVHLAAQVPQLTVPLVLSDPQAGFQITEYCSGKSLAEKSFVEMDWLSGLGSMLFNIHQLPKHGESLDYLAHCQHYLNHAAPPRLWGSKLQQQINLVAPLFGDMSAGERSLCHHDLGPENVLADSGRLLALDWEYARVGSAAIDIAIVIDTHKLTTDQSDDLLQVYRKAGGSLDLDDVKKVEVVPALFDVLWHLLYARLHDTDVDSAVIEEKLTRVEDLLSL